MDWIDLYLYVAKESTLRGYNKLVDDFVSKQNPTDLLYDFGKIPTAEHMLNKFGRFIINNNDIYYIPPQVTNKSPTKINSLIIIPTHDTIVGRADGKIIQSIALIQLFLMLNTLQTTNELQNKIKGPLCIRQNDLNIALSKNRDAINESLTIHY